MSDYYHADYFRAACGGYDNYWEQEAALLDTFARLMSTLAKREMTGGSMLEVGCGYGFLLRAARGYFGYLAGTEMSVTAAEVARYHADLVVHGDASAVPEDMRFDCVIATHVIEHTYNPQEFVRNMLARTRKDGWVLVAAPHYGSLWRRAMGRRWPSYKIPEHVLFFDAITLRRLLIEVGVIDVQRIPYPHTFPISLIGRKLSLRVPRQVAGMRLTLPGTTVAFYGRRA